MRQAKKLKRILLIGFIFSILLLNINVRSQNINLLVGTDIPYQFYIGGAYDISSFEISYKTGMLISPYSDAILGVIESLGAAPVYTELLHSAYRFGWMNTINVTYFLGKAKLWYIGPDFRLDKLTSSETSTELIEIISGEDITNYWRPRQVETNINLGVNLTALGLRFGRTFKLGKETKNSFRVELSSAKYLLSKAKVEIDDVTSDKLSTIFDDLLWRDVFKSYGYLGGIGFSYCFKF